MPAITEKQRKFLDSDEAKEIRNALRSMEKDSSYNTDPTYISNGIKYPGNEISFEEKHMKYLSEHPKLNPQQYLSNLKLMTRLKR